MNHLERDLQQVKTEFKETCSALLLLTREKGDLKEHSLKLEHKLDLQDELVKELSSSREKVLVLERLLEVSSNEVNKLRESHGLFEARNSELTLEVRVLHVGTVAVVYCHILCCMCDQNYWSVYTHFIMSSNFCCCCDSLAHSPYHALHK